MEKDFSTPKTEHDLEERVQLSLLYDFYGALLKENQKRIFEASILDDFNLSEIAMEEGISRQGVHDALKRSIRQLYEYEEKLGLLTRFKNQELQIKKLQNLLHALPVLENTRELMEMERILEELLKDC